MIDSGWRDLWMGLGFFGFVISHLGILYITEEWVKSFWWDLDPYEKLTAWEDFTFIQKIVLLLCTIQNYAVFFIAMGVLLVAYSFLVALIWATFLQFIYYLLTRPFRSS